MGTATITVFENKSSKQATDYSFGMSLSDVSALIDNALPEKAEISKIELQLNCEASVSIGYANVTTYVSLCDSDSNANSSSKSTQLISVSYKSTDGKQNKTATVTNYFNWRDPYTKQNTNYSRLSVYFDTSNITNKTFTCNYVKLVVTYTDPVTVSPIIYPEGAGTVSGGGVYGASDTITLTAKPNDGYSFKYWQVTSKEGITGNIGSTNPYTSVAALLETSFLLTAVFEKVKINNIYIGTSKPSKIYLGTQEVKEVYIGTTKVYG